MTRSSPLLLLVAATLSACSDPASPMPDAGVPLFSVTPPPSSFNALAQCGPDTGENIAFGGEIIDRVHETTDARGKVHRHRVFVASGMTGTGVNSGTTYEVLGGAEMFMWQYDEQGMLRLRIHQGTLVFSAADHRIIARHVIRVVPGRGGDFNDWICRRVAD